MTDKLMNSLGVRRLVKVERPPERNRFEAILTGKRPGSITCATTS